MRARTSIEEPKKKGGKESIIVTELPYQVNKSRLLEKMADLAREKVIEGITDLRDESDRHGMRDRHRASSRRGAGGCAQ